MATRGSYVPKLDQLQYFMSYHAEIHFVSENVQTKCQSVLLYIIVLTSILVVRFKSGL